LTYRVSVDTPTVLISAYARSGQVWVRMLRHYDAIGLLKPDRLALGRPPGGWHES
jgi:hypothetical protein